MGKLVRIIVFCFAVIFSAQTLAAQSAVYYIQNQVVNKNTANTPIPQTPVPPEYEKLTENEQLELYLNKKTLGLKVKNKQTGYVWSTTIDEEQEDLNRVWQGMVSSAITIEYVNSKNLMARASIFTEERMPQVTEKADGFSASVYFSKPSIQLVLDVTLTQNALDVQVKQSNIEELDEEYELQAIYVYPFLGATKKQEVSGYMFIPDGAGALIRLEVENHFSKEPYSKRIYGDDNGIKPLPEYFDHLEPQKQIQYPVFGFVHNEHENGFAAIIKSGQEYAELQSYLSGMTTSFNWTAPRFIYREQYFQKINRKGTGVIVNQRIPNAFDIHLSYTFLEKEEASYVGMAKAYREYLIAEGILTKKEVTDSSIPLRLDVIMSFNEKRILGKKTQIMTSLEDLQRMVDELNDQIQNIQVTVRGYTEAGPDGIALNHFPFEKKLGTEADWKKLYDQFEAKNIPLHFFTDYSWGDDFIKGYSASRDTAQSIAKNTIGHLVAPAVTKSFFERDQENFVKHNFSYLTIDGVARLLFSNFNDLNASTRSESIRHYTSMLENSKTKNAFIAPQDFLWKYSDVIYSVNLSSSNNFIFSDDVPFLQIVLKGYIDYFSGELNFADNSAALRLIEYGAYPSYFLTQEDSVKLVNGYFGWIYTSKFSNWKEDILAQHAYISQALDPVRNATIEDRRVLEDNVVLVTYSNGVDILVNYSNEVFRYNEFAVPANNVLVMD